MQDARFTWWTLEDQPVAQLALHSAACDRGAEARGRCRIEAERRTRTIGGRATAIKKAEQHVKQHESKHIRKKEKFTVGGFGGLTVAAGHRGQRSWRLHSALLQCRRLARRVSHGGQKENRSLESSGRRWRGRSYPNLDGLEDARSKTAITTLAGPATLVMDKERARGARLQEHEESSNRVEIESDRDYESCWLVGSRRVEEIEEERDERRE
ncbi:unnamed protein product [Pleuronectes platessa]|uniref:Uncharacterized protein n=1 Tax=Pleuronectes platessa TaxID=8262 RepID=A0A9N7YQ23_PLEPL|nr:unnamed protein product [Pleuronectes platessa]